MGKPCASDNWVPCLSLRFSIASICCGLPRKQQFLVFGAEAAHIHYNNIAQKTPPHPQFHTSKAMSPGYCERHILKGDRAVAAQHYPKGVDKLVNMSLAPPEPHNDAAAVVPTPPWLASEMQLDNLSKRRRPSARTSGGVMGDALGCGASLSVAISVIDKSSAAPMTENSCSEPDAPLASSSR